MIDTYNNKIQSINEKIEYLKSHGIDTEQIIFELQKRIVKFKLFQKVHELKLNQSKKENFINLETRDKLYKLYSLNVDKISKKRNLIENFRSRINVIIPKITLKSIKKLKREPQLENLFKFFFVHLYKENENRFKYDKFVKYSFSKENISLFQKKLLQYKVSDDTLDSFDKSLLDFDTYKKNQETLGLVHMLEYLDYQLNISSLLNRIEEMKDDFFKCSRKFQKYQLTDKFLDQVYYLNNSIVEASAQGAEVIESNTKELENIKAQFGEKYFSNSVKVNNSIEKINKSLEI